MQSSSVEDKISHEDSDLRRIPAGLPYRVWLVLALVAVERFSYWGVLTPWRRLPAFCSLGAVRLISSQRTTSKTVVTTLFAREHLVWVNQRQLHCLMCTTSALLWLPFPQAF